MNTASWSNAILLAMIIATVAHGQVLSSAGSLLAIEKGFAGGEGPSPRIRGTAGPRF